MSTYIFAVKSKLVHKNFTSGAVHMKAPLIFLEEWQVSMALLTPSRYLANGKHQALPVWSGLVLTHPSAVGLSITWLCLDHCGCPVRV